VPGTLKHLYKCTPEKPIQSLIKEAENYQDERYYNSSRTYTGVQCLTLELELTRCGDEGEFEDDRTKNEREIFEEEINTVYRFNFKEAVQMILEWKLRV